MNPYYTYVINLSNNNIFTLSLLIKFKIEIKILKIYNEQQ